jgi:hypothetical protein
MTVDELLEPRFKVIADYPHSPFTVGAIMDKWNSISPDMQHYGKYPHLFKKLEWWEERQPGEMPEYVKGKKSVYKVKTYDFDTDTAFIIGTDGIIRLSLLAFVSRCFPATSEEYEAQQNTPCKP